jgi:hypothetical protein
MRSLVTYLNSAIYNYCSLTLSDLSLKNENEPKKTGGRTMRTKRLVTLIAGISLMLAVTLTHGQSYSVSFGGPTPIAGDDIVNPGPIPFLPGVGIEVDAFSYGHAFDFPITDFQFSVDRTSIGAPGTDVSIESVFGDQAADIYNSRGTGFNTQLWDGDGLPFALPPAPSLGLLEPFGDNVDGWDNRPAPGQFIYFTADGASAPLIGTPSGADVMISPAFPGYDGIPAPYAPAPLLGLDFFGPGTDDIDALVVFDHSGAPGAFDAADYVLFSLTPGSASLAFPSPYTGLAPGDVMIAFAGGGGGLFAPGGALGLAPGDNLNALDVIPEPGVVTMLLLGGAGLYIRRRFFSC